MYNWQNKEKIVKGDRKYEGSLWEDPESDREYRCNRVEHTKLTLNSGRRHQKYEIVYSLRFSLILQRGKHNDYWPE